MQTFFQITKDLKKKDEGVGEDGSALLSPFKTHISVSCYGTEFVLRWMAFNCPTKEGQQNEIWDNLKNAPQYISEISSANGVKRWTVIS